MTSIARTAGFYGGNVGRTDGRMEKSRLRWQCRRGMRELDDLLLRYLERHYDDAPADEKDAFHAFLLLSDPELMGYLLQKQQPTAEFDRVVAHILDRPHP